VSGVVCLGITCADVLVRGLDTARFTGERQKVDQVELGAGGDAANQAIVLARLGVSVKLVTGLGDDNIGWLLRSVIADSGADTSGINVSHGPSPINVVLVSPDGQRFFVNAGMAASSSFEPDLNELRDARVVSLGSLFVPPLNDLGRIARVIEAARGSGSVVCADVIWHPEVGMLRDLGEALHGIDYLFPNFTEACQQTGKDSLADAADTLLSWGIGSVVIKTGADGCYVKSAQGESSFPAIGPKAVDTTGAGDNFAAGFITGLLEGRDLDACCELAAGTAGVAVGSLGANTGVKSRAQVEEFIGRYRV